MKKAITVFILSVVFITNLFAGEKYERALKAMKDGNYILCIELYKKAIPAEKESEMKQNFFSSYSNIPLVESYIALGKFDEAVSAFESNEYASFRSILNLDKKKTRFECDGVRLNGNLLKTWPIDKVTTDARLHVFDAMMLEFVQFYQHSKDEFMKSPFIRHLDRTGNQSIEKSCDFAANYLFGFISGYRGGAFPIEYLYFAADFGHEEAIDILANAYCLGYFHINGEEISIPKNFEQALIYWELLAEKDIPLALYNTAGLMTDGSVAPTDTLTALKYYDRLTKIDTELNFMTEKAYKFIASYNKKAGDDSGYFITLRNALDNGHLWAANNLGECYKRGIGCDVSFENAYRTFLKGTETDVKFEKSMCQYQTAILMKSGKGCPENKEKALGLLRESAEYGFIFSKFLLATDMYDSGNYSESFRWASSLSENIEILAQSPRSRICSLMAKMYEFGRGTGIDSKKAEYWWTKAAEYGDEDAEQIRQWLGL